MCQVSAGQIYCIWTSVSHRNLGAISHIVWCLICVMTAQSNWKKDYRLGLREMETLWLLLVCSRMEMNTACLKCGNEAWFHRLPVFNKNTGFCSTVCQTGGRKESCCVFPICLCFTLSVFPLGGIVRFWLQFSSKRGECNCCARGGGQWGLPSEQSGWFDFSSPTMTNTFPSMTSHLVFLNNVNCCSFDCVRCFVSLSWYRVQ